MEDLEGLNGAAFFCSWSGGKDSCLALHRAIEAGGEPRLLLTVLTEQGERSRSHGLARSVLAAQAAALSLPLRTVAASWGDYEAQFGSALRGMRTEGIGAGVYGDIDGESNRVWAEQTSRSTGIGAYLPLWQKNRSDILDGFLGLGYQAMIVAARADRIERSCLGQMLTRELCAEFGRRGIDPCGENGEFHTVVLAGPLFRRPVAVAPQGMVWRDGYWFLDLALADDHTSLGTAPAVSGSD